MADGISEISTRRGFDVREFALLAIGGGGGLCGVAIADILGVDDIIVPKFSSSFSAWSMFALDMGRDYLRSYFSHTTDCDIAAVNQLFCDMMQEAFSDFQALNVFDQDVIFEKSIDARYAGQYHELEMPLPSGEITAVHIRNLGAEFHGKHKELFTFSMDWVPVEIRNLRLIARVKAQKRALPCIAQDTVDPATALKGRRECFFRGDFKMTAIFDGAHLKSGNLLEGPSIIEEPTTTVVIPEGFQCRVDNYGNYMVRKNHHGQC